MALTDTAIKNAKVGMIAAKLFDGGGLHLFVCASSGKIRRMKYHHLGKKKILSLGAYPAISLKQARDKCEAAKVILAKGGDPRIEKKTAAVEANELIEKRDTEGLKDITTTKANWL